MRTGRALASLCVVSSCLLAVPLAAQAPAPAGTAAGAAAAQASSAEGPAAAPPAAVNAPTIDPRTDTGLVPRPAVQTGDEWLYRRATGRASHVVRQSISALSEQGISLKTEVPGSGESVVTVHDREWRLIGSGYNDYSPALAYYSFPLYPGKRWGIDSQVSNFGAGQSGRMKGEGRAIGWEEVEVPAGRFLALRIEIAIDTADPGDAKRVLTVRETHWYSRLVLRPVKVESETVVAGEAARGETVELVSYRIE